jgi:DUF4097 and DUF4098 domain-containing protein YvlB
MIMKYIKLLPLVLFLAASPALASGTPIDQTRDVGAHDQIHINNVKGAVHVTAWDQNKVHITGSLGTGALPLEITRDGDTLNITVKGPGHKGWFSWHSDNDMGPTVLDVQIPRTAGLDIDVVSADADAKGLDGGNIKINSVSGHVRLDASSPKVEINTVSGQVMLSGVMRTADIQTVSGDILAPSVGDSGQFQTVSGDVRVEGGPYGRVSMNTVSGDIDLSGALQPDGRIDIDSVSGDVHLTLPADLSAKLKASTFSGSLHSAFGKVTEKNHGTGSSIDSVSGEGKGHIHVETFSGDVRIGKAD